MTKQVFRYRHAILSRGELCHSSDEFRFSRKPNNRSGANGNISLNWLVAVYTIEVPDGTRRERTFSEDIRMSVPGWSIGLDAEQLTRAAEDNAQGIRLIERRRVEAPSGWEAEARTAENYWIGEEITAFKPGKKPA